MNTRSYPRTLNEAFRKTAEYGAAIERPAPRTWAVVYVAAIVVLILSIAFWGAP